VDTISQYTPERLAQFALEPIIPGKIIFLGDSITQMGDWRKELNDSSVINRGVGGDMTSRVLRRLKDITDRNPSKVFILLGINDIRKNLPDIVIVGNYLKIVREIHSKCPRTIIYVQGVLPLNPVLSRVQRHYEKQQRILALNHLLASHARDENYIYIDIFHLFADDKGHLSSQYTYDGLHLRPFAYPIWVDYLKKQGHI
jgi:lysophospholipase L1-like esterase